MTTPLRFIPDDAKRWTDTRGRPIAVVEVTIRTIQGRFLLAPTERNKSLILGVLGRALKLHDFELYGYAFLSNHGSMLIGVHSATHLSAIMQHIHSNIARELGRPQQSDWSARFWQRRGRAILVLTDEDLQARMKYLLANSTKEALVRKPTRWPGAHCAQALCFGRADVGAWVDRTRLCALKRLARAKKGRKSRVTEASATTWLPVTMKQLPCWAELSAAKYRQVIRDLCRDIEAEAAAERAESGREVVGAKRLRRVDPHHRPEHLETSPAPPVHCREPDLRQGFLIAYRWFVDAYREAYRCLRARLCAEAKWPLEGEHFPPGGVVPGAVGAVACA